MENSSYIKYLDDELLENMLMFDLSETIISQPEPILRTGLNHLEYTDSEFMSYEKSNNSGLNRIFELTECNNETSNIENLKTKIHASKKNRREVCGQRRKNTICTRCLGSEHISRNCKTKYHQ